MIVYQVLVRNTWVTCDENTYKSNKSIDPTSVQMTDSDFQQVEQSAAKFYVKSGTCEVCTMRFGAEIVVANFPTRTRAITSATILNKLWQEK